ncbi:MAG TPA: hypothetical protein VM580_09930 [Labilithrix sp.]|nr:hypothetical protein [Labilithrix sp.]
MPRLLAVLRGVGLPFLRGTDDATLRTLALSVRTAARRMVAGPLRNVTTMSTDDEVGFAYLGDADVVTVLAHNREAFLAKCAPASSWAR